MKRREKLNDLPEENAETLGKMLAELSEDELVQVTGGTFLNDSGRTCKGVATTNVLYTEKLGVSIVAASTFTQLKTRSGQSLDIEDTDSITVS